LGQTVDVIGLRVAAPEDERRLAFLDRVTWAPENSPIPLWNESLDFFSSDPAENVIVAESDGTPIGYVKLRRVDGKESGVMEFAISGIAVEPEWQRKGIGSRLVAEAIEEAKRRGAIRLALHVLGTNQAAIALYESHAFRIAMVRSGAFLIDGTSVDDLVMERTPL
jgi:ribosomal protein S18 acetylase RimI-like enzyme